MCCGAVYSLFVAFAKVVSGNNGFSVFGALPGMHVSTNLAGLVCVAVGAYKDLFLPILFVSEL